MGKRTETTLEAAGWSEWQWIDRGLFALSIIDQTPAPPFSATVTLQRNSRPPSHGNPGDGNTVQTYTAATEDVGEEGSGNFYRVGIDTGDYTSGKIHLVLAQGVR